MVSICFMLNITKTWWGALHFELYIEKYKSCENQTLPIRWGRVQGFQICVFYCAKMRMSRSSFSFVFIFFMFFFFKFDKSYITLKYFSLPFICRNTQLNRVKIDDFIAENYKVVHRFWHRALFTIDWYNL